MDKTKPIPSIKLTTLREQAPLLLEFKEVFVLKHRGASHPVASGVYKTYKQAMKDLNTIPGGAREFTGSNTYCHGCGVGCHDEYEVVRISTRMKPRLIKKIKVKLLNK